MRIVLLGNNWVALEVLKRLRSQGDEIVCLVIHPSDKQKYGSEIRSASGLDNSRILTASDLRSPETLQFLKSLNADVALSVFFGYIIQKPFLRLFPRGCLNL